VDHLQSPIPGLIAQVKGIPTTSRYRYATVFVDHFSDVTYTFFQKTILADETVQAKISFERWAATYGVQVQRYHADNGRFSENEFIQHIQDSGQSITFCGVNAHFQNGKAERRIRTLQEIARTQLLHAKSKWPIAITSNLWPYAVRNAADIMNDSIANDEISTRIEKFSDMEIRPNINHHHHFGAPTYVLDNALQAGQKISKWSPRARIGIYLCKSSKHARSSL
jgi:hypothetical protein